MESDFPSSKLLWNPFIRIMESETTKMEYSSGLNWIKNRNRGMIQPCASKLRLTTDFIDFRMHG